MSRHDKGSYHVWTIEEDAKLEESMDEIKRRVNWDGASIDVSDGSLKVKYHYNYVYDLYTFDGIVMNYVWIYILHHQDCTFMKKKSSPYHDQLAFVRGKDRATGINAETPRDVVEELEREQNLNEKDKEFDEDYVRIIQPTTKSRDEGSSKKHEQKRKKSMHDLILNLEHMVNAFTAHMDKSNEQMAKFVESLVGVEKKRRDNRHKLNEKLQKVEALTNASRQKVAIKLVRDPDLFDYFILLEDDDEKEIFLAELLRET